MSNQDDKESVFQPEEDGTTLGQTSRTWAAHLLQQRLQALPWRNFTAAVARRYARPGDWPRTAEARSKSALQESTAAGPGAGPPGEAPLLAGQLAHLARTSPQSLDQRSREILAAILARPIPQVKIYANTLADNIVRQYRADALSFRNLILMRSHLFAPRRAEGLALLGHELTHAQQSPFPAPGDEDEALAQEQKILSAWQPGAGTPPTASPRDWPLPGLPGDPGRGSTVRPGLTPASAQEPPSRPLDTGSGGTVRAARPDRPLGTATSGASADAALTDLSEGQLRLIKEEVYRDILQRIRTEFERGG